jgi:hypothetical protein
MGWSSGSEVFRTVWKEIYPHIQDKKTRILVAKGIIIAFEDADWDCHDDALDLPEIKDAMQELHPDWGF